MVLELGQGDQHIGVLVSVVEIEGGEHVAAPGHAQASVFLALAQVARVLELDLAQGAQRRHIPASLRKQGFQPVALLRGFHQSNAPGARGEQQRTQRHRGRVMRHVRFADGPAQERFEVAAGQADATQHAG